MPVPQTDGTSSSLVQVFRRALQYGLAHMLAARLGTQALSFVSGIVLAGVLGEAEYGQIRLLTTWHSLMVVFGSLGLNAALIKYASTDDAPATRWGLLRTTSRWTVLATTALAGLVAGLAWMGWLSSDRGTGLLIALIAPAAIPGVLAQVDTCWLQARLRVRELGLVTLAARAVGVALLLGGAWYAGAAGWTVGMLVGAIVAWIALRALVRRDDDRPREHVAPVTPPRSMQSMAFYVWITAIFGQLGAYGDLVVLDWLSVDRTELGHYAFASSFLLAARAVHNSVDAVATPRIARNIRDPEWMRVQMARNSLRLVALSVAVALGILAGTWVLTRTAWLTPYRDALPHVGVLLVSFVAVSTYAFRAWGLFAMGRTHYNLWASIASTGVGLGAAVLLHREMGVIGVAWAQTVRVVVQGAMLEWAWRYEWRQRYPEG